MPTSMGFTLRPCPAWFSRPRGHAGFGTNHLVVNLDLTDEQKLIRETAREFADREIIPRARDNDRNERFDLELVGKLGEMGYLGAPVDEKYGGRSLDYVSYGLVVEEIGRGDSSARTVVSVQTSLVAGSIEQWGTEEQKHDLLPKLCSGEWLRWFGPAHPGGGRGAGARVRCRIGGHPCDTQERRLGDLRVEDVHLARKPRADRVDLRPDRS